jgi:hypothetical protein
VPLATPLGGYGHILFEIVERKRHLPSGDRRVFPAVDANHFPAPIDKRSARIPRIDIGGHLNPFDAALRAVRICHNARADGVCQSRVSYSGMSHGKDRFRVSELVGLSDREDWILVGVVEPQQRKVERAVSSNEGCSTFPAVMKADGYFLFKSVWPVEHVTSGHDQSVRMHDESRPETSFPLDEHGCANRLLEILSNVVDRPRELGGGLLHLSSSVLRFLLHAVDEAHAGAHQRQQFRAIHLSPALFRHGQQLEGHHQRLRA